MLSPPGQWRWDVLHCCCSTLSFRVVLPGGALKVTVKRFGWVSQQCTAAVLQQENCLGSLMESHASTSHQPFTSRFFNVVKDGNSRWKHNECAGSLCHSLDCSVEDLGTFRPAAQSIPSVCQPHRGRNIWKTIVSNLFMLLLYNDTALPQDSRQGCLRLCEEGTITLWDLSVCMK